MFIDEREIENKRTNEEKYETVKKGRRLICKTSEEKGEKAK